MSTTQVAAALSGAGLVLVLAVLALTLASLIPGWGFTISQTLADAVLVVANMLFAAANIIGRNWAWAVIAAALAAWIAWQIWRKHRDDFRCALGLAGAKSRARIAALVAKMRKSIKPRPILRPVPGGAR